MRSLMLPFAIGSIMLLWTSAGHAQKPTQSIPVRIGTFDSRAISIAFYNSAQFREQVRHFDTMLGEARSAGDEEQVEKMEAYKPAYQQVMHQQGFSTGSVREIMEKIKDELPQIAEDAGVSMIVSKWEVTHHNPAVELVDLTRELAVLFEPSDQVLQWIESMKEQDPVPLDELLGWSPEGDK